MKKYHYKPPSLVSALEQYVGGKWRYDDKEQLYFLDESPATPEITTKALKAQEIRFEEKPDPQTEVVKIAMTEKQAVSAIVLSSWLSTRGAESPTNLLSAHMDGHSRRWREFVGEVVAVRASSQAQAAR